MSAHSIGELEVFSLLICEKNRKKPKKEAKILRGG
jgi:hypothetical protein